MSNPANIYVSPEHSVKISMVLDEHELVQALVNSNHDGFKGYNLFKILIKAYANNDPSIRKFVDDFRKKNKMVDKAQLKVEHKQYKLKEEFEKQMFLSEEEIDDIYDILETA